MNSRIIAFSILIISCFSCRRSNLDSPATPSTQDSLLNWKEIGNIPNVFLDDIWFTSSSNGFVVSDNIYQTIDSGNTWGSIPGTSATSGFYNLFFINAEVGFAQGPSQLSITVNGGNTWAAKSLPSTGAYTIFFLSASTGFYGDENGKGLNKTTDTGTSWVSVFNDQKIPQDYYPYFINEDTGYVATGSGTFAITVNGGQDWQTRVGNLAGNSSSGIYNQLTFLDINDGFYCCPSGILKTTDGGLTWVNVLPISGSEVNIIKFLNPEIGYYKGKSAIYKTSDAGQTWVVNCKLGSEHFIGMHFLDIHTGWACTDHGRILRIQQ